MEGNSLEMLQIANNFTIFYKSLHIFSSWKIYENDVYCNYNVIKMYRGVVCRNQIFVSVWMKN